MREARIRRLAVIDEQHALVRLISLTDAAFRPRARRDSRGNMKTAELDVRDHLNGLEREWVIGRLISRGGVRGALYQGDDAHRLVVEYDADQVSPSDLLDFLYTCGLQAESVPLKL